MSATPATEDKTVDFSTLRQEFINKKEQRDKLTSQLDSLKNDMELGFAKFILIESAKLEIDPNKLFAKRGRKSKANGAAKASIAPLYRDPANPANVWSGRGKPAKWLQTYMDAGRSKEEFKIKDTAPAAKPAAPAKEAAKPATKPTK